MQSLVVAALVARSSQTQPTCAILRVCWDETGEKLTVPVKNGMHAAYLAACCVQRVIGQLHIYLAGMEEGREC